MPFNKGEQLKKSHKHMSVYDPYAYKTEKDDKSPYMSMLEENINEYQKFCSWCRSNPDLFLDLITPQGSTFRLFFYQRVFLRIVMRYKYTYATFTRAFSKSFLSILALFLKCIFYPGIKVFIASGGKEQAANIAREKLEELTSIWPVLRREIRDIQTTKDYVKVTFQNGSKLDIVAVQNSTRGGRRNSGLIEEAILVDGQKLSEIIIPLMNVDRRAKNGKVDPDEIHQQQSYVINQNISSSIA